ncbi:unnamed protein product [Cuscuta epithymum]|uniref:Uncharacterized protein n=1 Tax=Cuscuta epithymum TaxID=186058 RepID=A0AAV0EM21_9ASTE|nr:unnamed protein product [Cuscuta epithymum]
MSEYVAFLDCLIDSEEDVTPLCEASIVRHQSHLFSHPQVAAFVNQLGKAAVCDAAGGYLRDVFVRVNNHFDKHYDDPWHVLIADVTQSHFKRYFSSPWKLTSVCAAVILLLLTVTQTIFTIMDYFKKD